MSITRINANVGSLLGQHNLRLNSERMAKSIERLSSGFRINGGGDDPSGLVISELLRAQVGGVTMAQENVAQAVNLIKTGEGALNEVSNALQQMRNLAVSAASDSTHNDDSRAALQEQVTSALTTIQTIAQTTKYAGRALLDGTAGTSATILDHTNIATASLGATAGPGQASVDVTAAATKATLTGSKTFALGTTVGGVAGNITINGRAIAIADTDTAAGIVNKINLESNNTGVIASHADTEGIKLTQVAWGSGGHIAYSESAEILNGGNGAGATGVDAVATVTWGNAATTTFDQGQGLRLQAADGNTITLTVAGNTVANHANALNVTQGQLSFQIGVNAGETANISVNSVKTSDLGISATLASVNISTVSGANTALGVIDEAIGQVSTMRGQLGAFLTNQLQAQGRSLAVTQQNLTASESQIRNTDFGAEMSEFTTSQILVQSATAFLSQANSMPQMVLQLIRG